MTSSYIKTNILTCIIYKIDYHYYSSVQDYVAWRVHSNYIGYLGSEWRAISDEFAATISGTTPKPRWQTCSDAANSVMEWAVGKLYIEEDFQVKKLTRTPPYYYLGRIKRNYDRPRGQSIQRFPRKHSI